MITYNGELLVSVKEIMKVTGIKYKKEIVDIIIGILKKGSDIVDYIKKDGEYFLTYIGAYEVLKNSNIDYHKIDELFA